MLFFEDGNDLITIDMINEVKPNSFFFSDVDPDWLYADPDPQNLMNADADPVRLQ